MCFRNRVLGATLGLESLSKTFIRSAKIDMEKKIVIFLCDGKKPIEFTNGFPVLDANCLFPESSNGGNSLCRGAVSQKNQDRLPFSQKEMGKRVAIFEVAFREMQAFIGFFPLLLIESVLGG